MIPAATITAAPSPPPTLVATPVFNATGVTYAPVDSVPASFSTVQIGPDARGNGGALPQPEVAPAPAAAASFSTAAATGGTLPGFGAPATFLAQLIGQYVSPHALLESVLEGYQRALVQYGNSYATLTTKSSQPSVYERFVQQQQAERAAQPQPRPQPAEVPAQAQQAQATPVAATLAAAPVVVKSQAQEKPQPAPAVVSEEPQEAPVLPAPIKLARAPIAIPSLAANAYKASATRIDAPAQKIANLA